MDYKISTSMMSDAGRGITDYRSSNRTDGNIRYIKNMYRDDEFRRYLQNNGNTLMNNEWKYIKDNNYHWPNSCIHDKFPTTPSLYEMARQHYVHDQVSLYGPSKVPEAKCASSQDFRLGKS